MCWVCGIFGEQISSHTAQSNGHHFDAIDNKSILNDHTNKSITDNNNNSVYPCSGGCNNYLHLKCAKTILNRQNTGSEYSTDGLILSITDEDLNKNLLEQNGLMNQTSGISVMCKLCLIGLRQCSICHVSVLYFIFF